MSDIQIPPHIWESSLTLTEIRIFQLIYSFRYSKQSFFWSDVAMAEKCGCHVKMVQRTIKKLVSLGFINSKVAHSKRILSIPERDCIEYRKSGEGLEPNDSLKEPNSSNAEPNGSNVELNGSTPYIYNKISLSTSMKESVLDRTSVLSTKDQSDKKSAHTNELIDCLIGDDEIIGSGMLKIPGMSFLALSIAEGQQLAADFKAKNYSKDTLMKILLHAESSIRSKTMDNPGNKNRIIADSYRFITWAEGDVAKTQKEFHNAKRHATLSQAVTKEKSNQSKNQRFKDDTNKRLQEANKKEVSKLVKAAMK